MGVIPSRHANTPSRKYQSVSPVWPLIFWPLIFTAKKSHDELIELLSSAQPLDRQAAIDGLASSRDLVPRFLDIMRHDPFIFVRQAAHHALVQSTGQHFNALDYVSWDNWWAQNKANWR